MKKISTKQQELDREKWKAEQREKRRRWRVAMITVCDATTVCSYLVGWWVGQWNGLGVTAVIAMCLATALGILLRVCWKEKGPIW